MKKTAQKRAFSLIMIVAVLSTSILACAFIPKNTSDNSKASTDQQIPFEENEKEFQDDKDEADEKSNFLALICKTTFSNNDADREPNFVFLNSARSLHRDPLFLTYHRFLI